MNCILVKIKLNASNTISVNINCSQELGTAYRRIRCENWSSIILLSLGDSLCWLLLQCPGRRVVPSRQRATFTTFNLVYILAPILKNFNLVPPSTFCISSPRFIQYGSIFLSGQPMLALWSRAYVIPSGFSRLTDHVTLFCSSLTERQRSSTFKNISSKLNLWLIAQSKHYEVRNVKVVTSEEKFKSEKELVSSNTYWRNSRVACCHFKTFKAHLAAIKWQRNDSSVQCLMLQLSGGECNSTNVSSDFYDDSSVRYYFLMN